MLCSVVMALFTACAVERPIAELPLSRDFVIPVSLAGQQVRMVLDTGCSRSVLASAARQRLTLPARSGAAVRATDATGAVRRVTTFVRTRDMRLGAIPYEDAEVLELPLGEWFEVDGLLGLDVARCVSWIFDPFKGRAVAMWPDQLQAQLLRHGLYIESEASLQLDAERNRLFVEIRCNDRPHVILLDTGAQRTSLPMQVIEGLGLPGGAALLRDQQREHAESIARAIGGARQVEVVTTHEGPAISTGLHGERRRRDVFHLSRLRLGSSDHHDLVVWDAPEGSQGFLGRDVLGEVVWAIDWRRNALLLLKRRGVDRAEVDGQTASTAR